MALSKKSLPIRPMTALRVPVIVQVTSVASPDGVRSKVVTLVALKGLRKSRSTATREGVDAVIRISPSPAFLLPDQWYVEPDAVVGAGELALQVGVEALPGRPLLPLVEVVEERVDARRGSLDPGAAGQREVGHGVRVDRRRSGACAARTTRTSGRSLWISCHVLPSSGEAHTPPLRPPK